MAATMSDPKPIGSVQDALMLIESFRGNPDDFQLAVPDTLLDAIGINMALITDRILQRGWQPDGYTQQQGFRLYRYKKLG
jgi:hypothetical protein